MFLSGRTPCRLSASRAASFVASIAILTVLFAGPAAAQSTSPAPAAPAAGQSEQEAQVPGLGRIFRAMPLDVWHFPSIETAQELGTGAALAFAAHSWDQAIADEVAESPEFEQALQSLNTYGNTYGGFVTQLGVGFAFYGIGRASDHPRLALTGSDILRSQVVAQVWTQALKYTVRRERPDGSGHVSFPSGHSASAFATAFVLNNHYGWKAGLPAYVAAGIVATSRIRSNKHYLSDVVFGAAMGIASARTVTIPAGRRRVAVAPSMVPGGAAVMFEWLPASRQPPRR